MHTTSNSILPTDEWVRKAFVRIKLDAVGQAIEDTISGQIIPLQKSGVMKKSYVVRLSGKIF